MEIGGAAQDAPSPSRALVADQRPAATDPTAERLACLRIQHCNGTGASLRQLLTGSDRVKNRQPTLLVLRVEGASG